ncbi:hypothetical protein AM493_07085 [Flavobacterium akiainvivens]|uniref:Uncharacterized protein n=1 Tax=Flavobacterium akiainvivens TaxID=1202724 RepID=A0A0M8MHE0_9FLAO|nr:hypothetical protein AM493_07085 [Flavobacterium akiainvivens]
MHKFNNDTFCIKIETFPYSPQHTKLATFENVIVVKISGLNFTFYKKDYNKVFHCQFVFCKLT